MVKAKEDANADALAGGKEVRPNRVSFSKVGDFVIGYKIQEKLIEANGKPTKVYQIKGVQGQFHGSVTTFDENGNKNVVVDKEPTMVYPGEYYTVFGGKDTIDDGMKKAKLGQKVGIQFTAATPSKKAGNSPFKIFKFVVFEDMDPETMGQAAEDEVMIG